MEPHPSTDRIDPLSVTSFVLSLVALPLVWCCCIGYIPGLIALILGAVALSRHHSEGFSPTSKNLAISGLAITAFAVILHIVAVIILQVSSPGTSWEEILRKLGES